MFKPLKLAIPALLAAGAMLVVFGGGVSGKDAFIGLSSPDALSQPPSAAPVRVVLDWSSIEVSPGIYNWSRRQDGVSLEKIINELTRSDSAPVLVLSGGPVYLPHLAGQQAVDSNALLERWQAFVSAAVEKFGSQTEFWQIGSGINNPVNWAKVVYPGANSMVAAPDPVLYGKMLRSAAEILRKQDSGSRVLLGSLQFSEDCSATPLAYLQALAAGSDWGMFDAAVLDLPAFITSPEIGKNFACVAGSDALAEIGAFLKKYGAKPFWAADLRWERSALEQAAATRGTFAEIVEADYLVRQSALLALIGAEHVLWQPAAGGFALPAQYAFSNLGNALGGARLISKNSVENEDNLILRFRRGGQTILLLWKTVGGDTPSPVILQDLLGMRANAFSADAPSLKTKSGAALEVDALGWSGLMLSERPVIVLAEHTDLKAGALAALEDKTKALGDSLKLAFNGWFETQKSKVASAVTDWAKEQQQSLLNMIKVRFEEWVKSSLGIASR